MSKAKIRQTTLVKKTQKVAVVSMAVLISTLEKQF